MVKQQKKLSVNLINNFLLLHQKPAFAGFFMEKSNFIESFLLLIATNRLI